MNTTFPTDLRASLEALLDRKRDYRQEVRELTEHYPHVVFYGCGAILHSIVETWMEQVGRKIDYVCDTDSAKWGQTFCGAKCLSPDELIAMKETCSIFVTIGDFRSVYTSLKARGCPSVNLIYKYDLVASDFLPRQDREEVLDRLCETYALLGDARSRTVFSAIVTRVLGPRDELGLMFDLWEKDQYFPPDLITLDPEERLVDVGAYNGDTVRDFIRRTGGKFGHIYAFELDAINFKAMDACVRALPERDRVTIFNLGAWDSEQDITYSIGKSQSTVGEGEGHGHVVPLDQALAGEKITMLKMDIEGAEPRGLRGAQNLIRSQKPKLAICIYHDFRHLWEIPLYIKSLAPEYTIYLRHHTSLEYETVCYALPGTPRP